MKTEDEQDESRVPEPPGPMNLAQVFLSVFAAAFGVRSGENRRRDFEQGSPFIFLLVGIGRLGRFDWRGW